MIASRVNLTCLPEQNQSKGMAKTQVSTDVGNDGVAVIKLYNPPVNSLSRGLFAKLKEKYQEAMRRDDVKAIVLTGEAGTFCVGLDINFLQEIHITGNMSFFDSNYPSFDLLGNTMEDGKKPSVAAIQGIAHGAGLELAMACHARIATPETQFAQPELSLGIIPGFGGTQRLPRLVGLAKAVDMMMSSKPIMTREAKDLGLIDAIVSSEELLKVSRLWALDIAERRKPWTLSLQRSDKTVSLPEAQEIIKKARQRMRKTARNMSNYHATLDVIEEGIAHGGFAGLVYEKKMAKELFLSDGCRGLVHGFLAQRMTSEVPKVTDIGLKPRRIKKVAIIGTGFMGSGIATSLILHNISVLIKGRDSKSMQRGMKMIAANLRGFVAGGKLTQDKSQKALSLVNGAVEYSELRDVDMVIESVVEDVAIKQSIFREIEKYCAPHCILATNTSTLDLNAIGEKISSQDRIIGAHFFSPAYVMPLLEIVRTEKTSPQAILDLINLGKILNKVPIVARNRVGFAVNRTFFPYYQMSHLLVNLGVDLSKIDRAAVNFGMPMGPFMLQDFVGFAVMAAVLAALGEGFMPAFRDKSMHSLLVDLMIKDGREGKKNGRGFYLYGKDGKPRPDPSLNAILEDFRRMMNSMPRGKPISMSDQEIVEMLFFSIVNEACKVMEEDVVVQASDLDVAFVLGLGFPSYRGGILFWADSIGPKYIYSRLKQWPETYGIDLKPSRFLEERAMKGIPLIAKATSDSQGSNARL